MDLGSDANIIPEKGTSLIDVSLRLLSAPARVSEGGVVPVMPPHVRQHTPCRSLMPTISDDTLFCRENDRPRGQGFHSFFGVGK